jgi:hypothetical protein
MLLVENEGGNGAALNDLVNSPATLFDIAGIADFALGFGLLFLSGVPERFDGTDNAAVCGPDGGRGKKEPLAALAHFGEKDLRFVGTLDQLRFFPFAAV